MKKPEICGSITQNDFSLIEAAEPMVDLFELRIDLVGEGWQEVVSRLRKPWIACNRRVEEGAKRDPMKKNVLQCCLKPSR